MAGESPEIHVFGSRTGKEKLDAANTIAILIDWSLD